MITTTMRELRKKQGQLGDTLIMDEVFLNVNGQRQYLWRAVDQDGGVVDFLVLSRRNKKAALRFFRKRLKRQGAPRKIVTDKLRSYGVARIEMMPSVLHCQDQYANNRAEASHRHVRQHERQMRRLKSRGQAQRFLAVHSQVHILYSVARNLLKGRHLLKNAQHYRMFHARSFDTWNEVTCAG